MTVPSLPFQPAFRRRHYNSTMRKEIVMNPSIRKSRSESPVGALSELPSIAGWKDPLNPLEEVVRLRLSACLSQVIELSRVDFKKELPQIAWLLDSAAAHLEAFQTVVGACRKATQATKGLAVTHPQ